MPQGTVAGAGVMMRVSLFLAPLVLLPALARADQAADAAQCRQAAGSFLAGTVTQGPIFKRSNERKQGVFLSHTHVTLRDQCARTSMTPRWRGTSSGGTRPVKTK